MISSFIIPTWNSEEPNYVILFALLKSLVLPDAPRDRPRCWGAHAPDQARWHCRFSLFGCETDWFVLGGNCFIEISISSRRKWILLVNLWENPRKIPMWYRHFIPENFFRTKIFESLMMVHVLLNLHSLSWYIQARSPIFRKRSSDGCDT